MDITDHPCFNGEKKHTHARVHLPVAPKCNVQCNYCNRKYDCVNESRPGVTSGVLTPVQAVDYLNKLNTKLDNLSVIGIAGPGDPFANPEDTIETLQRVKKLMPDKLLCISTNGLGLLPYIDRLAQLQVSHVTLTINAVDTQIVAQIYKWIRYQNKVYKDVTGAEILLQQQLACIPKLKSHGITVKINSIIIPGINEHHIAEVARTCASLGADIINCLPLIPVKGTPFENIAEPDKKLIFKTRTLAAEHLPLMTHCARCRADAAGLLGHDLTDSHALLKEFAIGETLPDPGDTQPYVAVATSDGMMVNLHLGEATTFHLFQKSPKGYKVVEMRKAPPSGGNDMRWLNLARLLADCRAILVSGIGENPRSMLESCGIQVIQMTGLIDEGLEGVYNHKLIRSLKDPSGFRCGSSCNGSARGCS